MVKFKNNINEIISLFMIMHDKNRAVVDAYYRKKIIFIAIPFILFLYDPGQMKDRITYFEGICIMSFLFFFAFKRLYYFLFKRNIRNYMNEALLQFTKYENSIEIQNDFLLAKNEVSESKILTSQIESIELLPERIYILLKAGSGLVISKDSLIEGDFENFCKELTNLKNKTFSENKNA